MISFQEKMARSTDYVKHYDFVLANGMMLMDTKYSSWRWKQSSKITTKFLKSQSKATKLQGGKKTPNQ